MGFHDILIYLPWHHDFPFGVGVTIGDPCWSQDAAADHEGCEAGSADGTSSSLDDRWKNHAPWIAGSETKKNVEPEPGKRFFRCQPQRLRLTLTQRVDLFGPCLNYRCPTLEVHTRDIPATSSNNNEPQVAAMRLCTKNRPHSLGLPEHQMTWGNCFSEYGQMFMLKLGCAASRCK